MTIKMSGRYLSCFQIQEKTSQLRISDMSELSDFVNIDHVKETKQNQGGSMFG